MRWHRCKTAVIVAIALSLTGLILPTAAQVPYTLTLATVNNMNHVPQFVAVEKGFYVKQGVDVKLKVLNSGAEVVRTLQAGDAQLATVANTTLSSAWNAGVRLIAIAVVMGDATRVYYDDTFAITARKGSGVRRLHVEDLVGKRVGMVLGGTGEEYFRAMLTRHNVPADRITFVNVPAPNHVSVMRGGDLDAEVTWEPYGTMILQQVPETYVVLRGGGYIGYNLYMMVPEDFIKKNPDLVEKVVHGFAEAAHYVRLNPVESARIATRWIEGLDVKAASKAITYMNFDPRFSQNTLTAHQIVERDMLERGRIKQAVDLRTAINSTYIEKLMRTNPQLFQDLKSVR